MITALVYAFIGFAAAALSGLAKGSMRRLIVAGALGILIAWAAFPFSRAVGFLSREQIDPTQFGLTTAFPLFWLVPLISVAALGLAHRGGALSGLGGLTAGLVTLLVSLAWVAKGAQVARVEPQIGWMEALAGTLLAALFVIIGNNLPRYRVPLIGAGILLGLFSFGWLKSEKGHTYFPSVQGYYKFLAPAGQGVEQELVDQYNAGLEALNAQRKEIDLPPLKPITSITGIQSGRIPREVAEQGYRLLTPSAMPYGSLVIFAFAGLLLGAGLFQLRRPALQQDDDLRAGLILASVIAVLVPAFDATEFMLQKLAKGWPFLVDFWHRAWPPNLAQPIDKIFPLQTAFSEIMLTVEIALVGTFLAAIFALPTSFLAARNLTLRNRVLRGVFYLMRTFYNADRGVDTLILALVFVAAVGLGPFAGVLAIAIHSIADLGKLYSEAIENVDKGPIEALESVGASGANVLRWGILPQVLPLFVSYTLYRFEINFRVSIVLGFVGAGGIGYFIKGAMDAGHYDQMIIGVIIVLIVVNIIDFASSWLRSRLV